MDTPQSRRVVRVNVAGGLGNQMFMYAAGRALAARIGAHLVINACGFRRDTTYKRVFLLDRFPISAEVLSDSWPTRLLGPLDRLARAFPGLTPGLSLYEEDRRGQYPSFNPSLLAPAPTRFSVLRGFWQDERYFRDCAEIVRRELPPPVPSDPIAVRELERIEQARHPVAVGIRFFEEVPGQPSDRDGIIASFRRVLMAHAAGEPDSTYFVFTEEPRHFVDPTCLGVRYTVITHRPRNEDALINLYLMSRCRSFFIGYSSYHWWGAWLSATVGKQVTYLRFPARPGQEYAADGWVMTDAGTSVES
jgi:hypothetical protein